MEIYRNLPSDIQDIIDKQLWERYHKPLKTEVLNLNEDLPLFLLPYRLQKELETIGVSHRVAMFLSSLILLFPKHYYNYFSHTYEEVEDFENNDNPSYSHNDIDIITASRELIKGLSYDNYKVHKESIITCFNICIDEFVCKLDNHYLNQWCIILNLNPFDLMTDYMENEMGDFNYESPKHIFVHYLFQVLDEISDVFLTNIETPVSSDQEEIFGELDLEEVDI